MLLAGVLAKQAFAEDEKALKCPVDNPVKKGEKREATPREASRQAADWWRAVENSSNNQTLRFTWPGSFARCLEASNRSLDEIVSSRRKFRHQVLRTYSAAVEKLKKDPGLMDIAKRLQEMREQDELLKRIAPELEADLTKFQFTKEELDELAAKSAKAKAAQKTDCGNVDLSGRLGLPRNQTDIGWCYAFTAADLVTFKVSSPESEFDTRISAADIGFAYNREFMKKEAMNGKDSADIDGGTVAGALKAALKVGGFCRETQAPSEDFSFGQLKETIREIEQFKVQVTQEEFGDERFCFAYRRTQELLPGLMAEDFARILNEAGERNMEYFEKLTDRNCRKDRQTYGLNENSMKEITGDGLKDGGTAKLLDGLLDKGNIAGVSFPMSMISNDKDAGYHVVSVVGRRFNEKSGQCEYLLRNSWGLGCSSNLKSELCAEDHSGHLWVSRNTINEDVYRISHLE